MQYKVILVPIGSSLQRYYIYINAFSGHFPCILAKCLGRDMCGQTKLRSYKAMQYAWFDFLLVFLINSILLHSGLNPAWHFWLSTRLSCCLKMKSVENILGYIREQFYRFSRGCKPRENLWNCSRKYTKMFKTDS